MRTLLQASITLLLLLFSACAAPVNYGLFREKIPDSILIIPPLNSSVEVEAPYVYLSTVSRPVAEMGYYVFPVAVVDAFMKDNGLPSPGEMNGVSLNKINEVFGADAVLYLEILDWGQKYQVLQSNTVVNIQARLVDVQSGLTLWQREVHEIRSSGGSNDGVLGMLISAAVTQALKANNLSQMRDLAKAANHSLFRRSSKGLLFGPRHPEFLSDERGR